MTTPYPFSAVVGLAYALFYHRTRRLWPLIVAHAAFDLTQLVLILLTKG